LLIKKSQIARPPYFAPIHNASSSRSKGSAASLSVLFSTDICPPWRRDDLAVASPTCPQGTFSASPRQKRHVVATAKSRGRPAGQNGPRIWRISLSCLNVAITMRFRRFVLTARKRRANSCRARVPSQRTVCRRAASIGYCQYVFGRPKIGVSLSLSLSSKNCERRSTDLAPCSQLRPVTYHARPTPPRRSSSSRNFCCHFGRCSRLSGSSRKITLQHFAGR
jgi:hypothetical protein